MEQKLTAQIYSAYYGAKVLIGDSLAPDNVALFTENSICTGRNKIDVELWYKISSAKLILTPLSSITDEHAIEVAKIIMPLCFFNRKLGWKVARNYAVTGYPYIKVWHPKKVLSLQIDPSIVGFDVDNMEDRETGRHDMKPVETIDYLRSKSYDLGYGNIKSLIESGIAISSLTLKSE